MSIPTSTNTTTGLGNGTTTVFAFGFYIPVANDLVVTYTDALGVITTLSPSQYAATGIGNAAGGTVTYPLAGPAIPSGSKLTITRIVPYTQPTTLTGQGGFYPQAVEAALDNLEMQIQQLANQTQAGVSTVSSVNGRTGAVTIISSDLAAAWGFTPIGPNLTGPITSVGNATAIASQTGTGTTFAMQASPTFTGTPSAPTATLGTNTTQIATTAFVQSAVAASVTGVSSFNTRTGAISLTSSDVTTALTFTPIGPNLSGLITSAGNVTSATAQTGTGSVLAMQASPAFTGTPTAPTATFGDSSAQIATTAFVQSAVAASVTGVSSFNTRTGAVTLSLADVNAVQVGTSSAKLSIWTNTGTGTVFNAFKANGAEKAYFGTENSGGGGLFGSGYAYGLSLGTITNTGLALATNNAVRVWLDGSGNFGLGASPSWPFQVHLGADKNFVVRTGGSTGILTGWINDAGTVWVGANYVALKHVFSAGSAGGTDALTISSTQGLWNSGVEVIGNMSYANVKAFGADPTGASACDSAISSAISAGYTALYFPKGTYKFTSAISTSGQNLTIYGDGPQNSRLIFNGAINGVTFVGTALNTQMHQLRVRDVAIVSNTITTVTGIDASWTSVGGDTFLGTVRAAIIENVEISNNSSNSRFATGIKLTNGNAALIRDCIFNQYNWSGSRDATGISLVTSGSFVPSDIQIRGCAFSNPQVGVSIVGNVQGTRIIDCSIVGALTGISADGSSLTQGLDWLHITGTHISAYNVGIQIVNVFHLDIANNYILALQNLGGVQFFGISCVRANSTSDFYEDSYINNNNFHLNDATYTAKYAIYIDGFSGTRKAKGITVEGNHFGGLTWTFGAVFGVNVTRCVYMGTNIGANSETCSNAGTGNVAQSPLV